MMLTQGKARKAGQKIIFSLLREATVPRTESVVAVHTP